MTKRQRMDMAWGWMCLAAIGIIVLLFGLSEGRFHVSCIFVIVFATGRSLWHMLKIERIEKREGTISN